MVCLNLQLKMWLSLQASGEIKGGNIMNIKELVADKHHVLTEEELLQIKDRTNNLFEVISMLEEKDPSKEQMQRECIQEIVELNIRLVPRVLKKYQPFGEDEMQIGCVGLIKAANSYNVERGVPFVNFACFCIERELHMAHKEMKNTFEYMLGSNLSSLDAEDILGNGDLVNRHELIPDEAAEAEFRQIIESENLDHLFDVVINPAIEDVAGNTKGQKAAVDFEKWRALELRYILDIANIESQKARFTLARLAKELGVSTQNVRMRHKRVLGAIRVRCEELGYLKKEEN